MGSGARCPPPNLLSPPTHRRRPSPSSSRWMMLSMLSLSISAIASQRPGGPLPAAPLPQLAARQGPAPPLAPCRRPLPAPCFLPSSQLRARCRRLPPLLSSLFSSPQPPRSAEPRRPHKMAAVSSAGSAGARIPRARGASPEALYRPGGKSAAEAGRVLRLRGHLRWILPPSGRGNSAGWQPVPRCYEGHRDRPGLGLLEPGRVWELQAVLCVSRWREVGVCLLSGLLPHGATCL